MLKRKAYSDLLAWKNSRKENKIKEVLSIRGARQIGKTSLVESFGVEYRTFIEINFANNPEYKEIFEDKLDKDELYTRIKLAFFKENFVEGETLIFLDEIQKCSKARTAIKVMAQDFRYDVITSGSLLGLMYNQDDDKEVDEPELLPVGFENIYNLNSLDFEEFLISQNVNEEIISKLREFYYSKKQIPDFLCNSLKKYFVDYMVLGGMPEVVQNYATYKDYKKAFKIQEKIISNYKDDIATHAKGAEKIKVRNCFNSIPSQLAKEIKKFQYSVVEKGQTSKKYGDSVQWLVDSQIVRISYNVKEPYLPLLGNAKTEQFKLYVHDTGLLLTMFGEETKLALLTNKLQGNAKGGIYENIVAQILSSNGYALYYYHPDDNHEIEFLIEKNQNAVPIEVKASNGQCVSLNNFINDFKPSLALKTIDGNIGYTSGKTTIPHFVLPFII